MYFFETLVRIHREGEGAPYTGLKPGEAIDPAVALADKALESGNVDKLVNVLTGAMANGIRERFTKAYENQKHADDNIEAGREFVESYVIFTHYVEGLHGLIKGGVHHGEGEESH
jgi:UDP-2,3-diacylglucosamine pyrophosphatase LpxH